MSILSEVLNSGESWAVDRANYALQVSEAVQNGQLNSEEAKEILNDLIRTEALEEASTNAQLRAALVFGITQLASMMA